MRLPLHHRLVVPIAAAALVAIAATAYVTLEVTERQVRRRTEARVLDAARVLAQGDFALNPAIIRSAGEIAGVEIVSFSGDTVLASTLDRGEALPFVAAAADADAGGDAVRWGICADPCAVVYRELPSRPGAMLAVVAHTTELDALSRNMAQTIGAASVVSIIVMLLVGQATARALTRPLARLVAFTGNVGRGGAARAEAGDDEVGTLGRAFNDMIDRLERSQEALVQSEKLALAGLFAARVAHDVRNPLSSIKMRTQLLHDHLQTTGDSATTASLAAVQRDILQVESVIQDLLELARPGSLARAPVRAAAVIGDALEQVRPNLAYRNITVSTALSPDAPVVSLDANRFRQALLNVITNAADAMPSGGTLTVRCDPEPAGGVAIEIADDGAGIDPDVLPRAFDPFVSTKPHGIGLGLVNAKAVVESHGGTIALARRPEGGTSVTIRLPRTAESHG